MVTATETQNLLEIGSRQRYAAETDTYLHHTFEETKMSKLWMRCLVGVVASLFVLMPVSAAFAQGKKPGKKAPVVPPRKGKREVVEIFNGKNLDGWVGHKKYWSVKDGVIIGKNTDQVKVSTYLLTKRKFTDFRLIFDFKLAKSEMHSGIAMWGRVAPDKGDKYTYAGHLVMFPSGYGFYDLYGRRLIHRNAKQARKVGKQHGWNHIEILAQGNRIRFVLNGVLISDWREPMPKRIKQAPIGLQLHSNRVPQEVQFKNLKLVAFPENKLLTVKKGGKGKGAKKTAGLVRGTYFIPATVPTFKKSTLDIRLYEYDPRIADKKATLVGQVKKKNFGHTKGKVTQAQFVLGKKAKYNPKMQYYVTLYVLKDKKRTHTGRCARHPKGLCKVLENENQSTVKMTIRPIGQ